MVQRCENWLVILTFTILYIIIYEHSQVFIVLYWSGCCLVEAGGGDRVVLHEHQPP